MVRKDEYDLLVVGGGAAGFFGAITCAEAAPRARVLIVEKSRDVLGKVRISGGGRCNLTHACFDPRELVANYPRGSKQLIGPLNHWGPGDTMSWFEQRGVPLKEEEDGRVFPVSDRSQSIIDCLVGSAWKAGVEVMKSMQVVAVKGRKEGGFELEFASGLRLGTRCLLLSLGGTRNRFGADLAQQFGHRVELAAPSLFTFRIDDRRLDGLQGLSVGEVELRVDELKLDACGPVLVTHWGLSGPGVLRLSAWGAREMQQREYRFELRVNWSGGMSEQQIMKRFEQLRVESPRRKLVNDAQFAIPSRLWIRLVAAALPEGGDAQALRWPHLSRQVALRLAAEIGECRFRVQGKSLNKDEFVTCGGVSLSDVNLRTMESRRVPGLYFAGEILDIDGLTGGFNFQAAWTSGRIAGESIADDY